MSLFTVFAILITLTAVFSFVNEAFVKLPTTIGVMVASLASSVLMIGLGYLGYGSTDFVVQIVKAADFDHLFMNGMLSLLLFAGALQVNIEELGKYKWSIAYLATAGMIIATLLTALALWWLLASLGVHMPFIYALIFGAIISPIDAVIVLKLFRRVHPGKVMESIISGESLFNDAIAIVLFVLFIDIATGNNTLKGFEIGELFVREAFGGILLGIVLGYISYKMIMKTISERRESHVVVALITLALVTGGYTIAGFIGASGPLTSVVSGLFLARRRRHIPSVNEHVRSYVNNFWEIIDDVLNAVLFVLIGLEVLVLNIQEHFIICGLLAVPIATAARYISVEVPLVFLKMVRRIPTLSGFVMTWSGIRGGVSIALALSIPESDERDLIILMTYVVVVFSILVQGLTLERAVKWHNSRAKH